MKLDTLYRARRSFIARALAFATAAVSATAGATIALEKTAYADETVTFETRLSPYGEWIASSRYGRVWRPHVSIVGSSFVPYSTAGHWVYTDDGWVFESDYAFSPIVFHYGRWVHDANLGWCWLPGNEWAPSWVSWRTGNGYVGWAPLGAPGEIRDESRWTFVREPEFTERYVHRHVVPIERTHHAFVTTAPMRERDGRRWSRGPDRDRIERATARPHVGTRPAPVTRPPTTRPSTSRPAPRGSREAPRHAAPPVRR